MRISGLHWLAAFALSLAAHAAILVGFKPQAVGLAEHTAGPPVEVAGSLAGILGASTQTDIVEPVVEEIVEPAVTQPVLEAVAAAPVEPVEAVETTQPPALTAQSTSESSVAVTAQPTADEPARPADPAPERSEISETAEAKPRPVETKAERKQHKPAQEAIAARKSPRGSDRQGQAGTTAGGTGGKRVASAGTMAGYGARVRARIVSNRPAATGRGRVVVSFGLSPEGGLRYASVVRSSGNASLDAVALAAVRRSSPFPRPPAGASTGQLRFTIPFVFH